MPVSPFVSGPFGPACGGAMNQVWTAVEAKLKEMFLRHHTGPCNFMNVIVSMAAPAQHL